QDERRGALADVERGDGVGVGAETEIGGMAEAQDAGEAPHQAERQGEQRPDREQGRGVGLGDQRQQQQRQHAGGEPDPLDADDPESGAGHVELRKKRPVTPCGIRRNSTMASASMARSPITGVEAKDTAWLTAPNTAALDSVPAITATPPVITVM